MNTTLPRLTAQGIELDLTSESFGELRRSDDVLHDAEQLQARMAEDGYLFLPGYLHREEVLAARQVMLEHLARQGNLDPAAPLDEARAHPDSNTHFNPELAIDNEPLMNVLYSGPMIEFWEHFFGESVLHFDYTWVRAIAPGHGTPPHCDIVYMGRGTHELYTAWTPIGDVSYEMGGLMVLEGSHRHEKLRENYCQKDVDAYCTNRRGEKWEQMGGGGNIRNGGMLSYQPRKLRERLGGRWLTSEFQAGDLLLFSVQTVHASLDNQSDRIRMSSDSRYQRASQPADERWIGPNPIGHGPDAKRGMIC